MGVSGAGKTTIGRLLARELGWLFIDGDDLHSPANIEKMSRGVGLTDEDRRGWLDDLAAAIRASLARDESVVVASSALKERYRERLRVDPDRVTFVFLRGSPALIGERLAERSGHFASEELLPSQLEALEEPAGAPTFDVSAPADGRCGRDPGGARALNDGLDPDPHRGARVPGDSALARRAPVVHRPVRGSGSHGDAPSGDSQRRAGAR